MNLDRQKQLLDYLVKVPNQWVSAQEIADVIGVSTRQVRKYVSDINEKDKEFHPIKSGAKGYSLDDEKYFSYKNKVDLQKTDTPQTRQNYIIQKLISSSRGYDVLDFAEDLFVSVPTIENDLNAVRKKLKDYFLTLKRKKDFISMEGDEVAKRKLMRNLILPDSYDNFVLKDEIKLLASHYRFWDLRKNVKRILVREKGVFTNDYTLNNIVLHIIVMIDRIRNGGVLKQGDLNANPFEQTVQYNVAVKLAAYISQMCDVQISDIEIYFLMITVYNNTTIVDFNSINIGNIDRYIDRKYIDLAKNVLGKVERIYYLDSFDNEFTTRFIIHVNNMFNRVESGYNVRNPLKAKVKTSFPLVYDIAVFIAQEFKNYYDIHLTEDEIAFIALHIGGYFENSLNKKNKVTCAFIYTDYYDAYKSITEKITSVFADVLTVKYIISLDQYMTEAVAVDIIISTVDMDFSDRHIIINPFLKESDMENIRKAVMHIMKKNRFSALKTYLFNFISSELFYKNPSFSDRTDAIITMTQNAIQFGYANDSLTDNVMQRESLSDTTFYDVAVPHSLKDDVIKSFISFAISDKPIKWGDKQVNIITLIGVNKDSRKVFTEIFDLLIDILSESKNVKELAGTSNYKDFYHKLITQIEMLR